MMSSTPPRPASVSNEELRSTHARLYRLLVEATDRLHREKGLPRTRAAEVARLNGNRRLSDSADDTSNGVSDEIERKESG